MAAIVALIAALGVGLVGVAVQKRRVGVRRIARNLLISYSVVVIPLALAEGYLRYFYADPAGRLASNNWMDRYWRENSRGHRDREWMPEDWAGRQTMLIVGDSFAAGWGVEDPADRFGDVLAAQLGEAWAVINISQVGASTLDELRIVRDYPLQTPDVIVWQYYLNDIEGAALSVGLGPNFAPIPLWARESHLLNYLYSLSNVGFSPAYWAWQYAAYDHPAIWAAHAAELEQVSAYAQSVGARLIVAIFPNMVDPVGSIPYVDRVAQVFEGRAHVDVLKLFDAVAAWERAEVIVSERDQHPSAAFHRFVGETLYEQYFAE